MFAKSADSIQTPILSLLSNKQRTQVRHGNSKKDTDRHYESQNSYWNSVNKEFSLSSWDWLTGGRRVAGFAWETDCRSGGQEIRDLLRNLNSVEKYKTRTHE